MRWFFLLLVGVSTHSFGQVAMGDFLQAAFNEPALKSFQAQQEFLSSKKVYRLAPIQRLEFRTESNQLDRTRQDYALRINPANPWEMKYTNRYFKTYQELLQLDRDRTLKESLLVRYEVIISWVYYQELLTLRAEDKKATENLLGIMEGQRFSTFFDAEDYVELKLDQVEKSIELEETRFEADNERSRVEALFPGARTQSIDWLEPLITVDRISRVVDSLMQTEPRSGETAYREMQVDLAASEWNLEKSNINVGFLQTEYQPWRLDQGQRPWSISLGVTIPIFNPNKGDMAQRKLEMLEAQGEADAARQQQQANRQLSREKLQSLVSRYHEIQSLTDELNIGKLATTVQQIQDSNPGAVVRVQSNQIQLKILAARLKREIHLAYLEFLSYSELLQQQPLINYLTSSLKPVTAE